MDQEKIQQFRDNQAQQADTQKQDDQHGEIVGSLNNLLLATMVSKDPKMVEVAQKLAGLLDQISSASDQFANSSLHLLPVANHELAGSIQELSSRIAQDSPQALKPYYEAMLQQLDMIASNKPVVNVPKQPVTVDLKPLIDSIKAVQAEVKKNKIDIPKNDLSSVVEGLKKVQEAVDAQRFPVSNYILPFKDINGKAVQVQLDSSGNVPTASSGGAAGTQYAELITTAPATGTVALGRYKSSAPTLTDGQLYTPQLDASGNLKVNIQAGAGSGGTAMVDDAAFTVATTSVTPVAGTYRTVRDAVDDNDGGALAMNAKRGLYVSLETPNSDSAMDDTLDTVKVSQATAANLNATATLAAGTAIVGKVTTDQTTHGTTDLVAADITKVAGSAISQGHGTAATAIRVELPTDGTGTVGLAAGSAVIGHVITDATSVTTATLSAETTKVIGVVRNSDGAGNLLTSNSTTPSAKFSLDQNITSILGTAPTTVGKIDVKGADGDVFVRQATASNLNATVVGTGTFATQTTIAAGATSIAKAEDVASADADVGVPALAVRKAAPANTSGTDGDYEFLQISAGRLWASATIDAALPAGANAIGKLAANAGVTIGAVEIAAAQTLATVTTVGTVTTLTGTTSLTPGVAAANLGKAEDAAHTTGDVGVGSLFVRNDALATQVNTDLDYGFPSMDIGNRVMVAQKAITATLSNVAGSATSVTLLAANNNRVGATITNDSSVVLYIKFGTTASTTSYTVVLAGAASAPFSYYEVPAGYAGRIDGIWASATGNARVTEIT